MSKIELKPETKTVPLFQGDDLEEIDRLREAVSSAMSQGGLTPTLDETDDPVLAAAKAHDDFVTEATERAVKIDVKVLSRRQWRSLKAEHPPRMVTEKVLADDGETEIEETEKPHPEDKFLGFNTETMPDALVPASIADGQFDTPADRDKFLDSLSDRNFSKLYSAAVWLNAGVASDPKADLSSVVRRMSGATSKSLEASD